MDRSQELRFSRLHDRLEFRVGFRLSLGFRAPQNPKAQLKAKVWRPVNRTKGFGCSVCHSPLMHETLRNSKPTLNVINCNVGP